MHRPALVQDAADKLQHHKCCACPSLCPDSVLLAVPQEVLARISAQLKDHVLMLSLQMYGCRVIQKALEVSCRGPPVTPSTVLPRQCCSFAGLSCHLGTLVEQELPAKMPCWVCQQLCAKYQLPQQGAGPASRTGHGPPAADSSNIQQCRPCTLSAPYSIGGAPLSAPLTLLI